MLEADALARLKMMTQWSVIPTLAEDELTILLADCRVVDQYGVRPSDSGWEGTYDLARAAAEGWRVKAAKVAGNFDFGSDVHNFSRSQVHTMCMEHAAMYDAQVVGSVEVASASVTYLPQDIWGNLNGGI